MLPVSEVNFFAISNTGFWSHSGHKTAAVFDKSDKSDYGVFLPLFLYLLTFGTCLLLGGSLPHGCQGGHAAMNEIDLDRGERDICRNYVDKILGQGKSQTLNKVGDSTVYRTEES